jgi:tetratricopeptide (TPR) repeat protein
MRIVVGSSENPTEDIAAASAAAARALECDPDDALALAVDAHVAAWARHDLGAAEAKLARALAANPNEPLAWIHSAITHSWRGRGDEAVDCAERALSLSPLDPMIYYFTSAAGQANLVAQRYDPAIEFSLRSLRENRLHTPTLRTLAAAQVFQGRVQEARHTVARLRELEPTLTVSAFKARYPGRDNPHAERFAAALEEAGLPA